MGDGRDDRHVKRDCGRRLTENCHRHGRMVQRTEVPVDAELSGRCQAPLPRRRRRRGRRVGVVHVARVVCGARARACGLSSSATRGGTQPTCPVECTWCGSRACRCAISAMVDFRCLCLLDHSASRLIHRHLCGGAKSHCSVLCFSAGGFGVGSVASVRCLRYQIIVCPGTSVCTTSTTGNTATICHWDQV